MRFFCVAIFLWFLFCVSGFLSWIPLVSNVDEFLAIFSYGYILCYYSRLSRYEKKICKCSFCLFIVGVIGNFLQGYQTAVFPIALDFLQCTKVFIVFVAANHYLGNLTEQKKKSILKSLAKIACVYVVSAFTCAVISLFVNIGMSADVRMGFRCFKFYYGNAGGYANSLYVVLMILTAYRSFFYKGTFAKLMILLTLFTWLLTFRSRGMLFIVIYILLYYFIIHKRIAIKLKIWSVCCAVALALFVTADQIDAYFNNENMPRAILLHYGVETMERFAPIGAGFGTYGTDVAVKFYSNLYKEYGLDERWGFTPENPLYALDSYWPAIFGQFGILGTIVVACLILFWIKQMISNNKGNRFFYAYTLFIVVTQVFSSLPTSTFFSPLTVVLFMFAPLLKENQVS